MIARIVPGKERGFFALLESDPLIGGQIATAFDCLGGKENLCGFYQMDHSAALLVQGGGALLCGRLEETQQEELAAFLQFSGVHALTGRLCALPGWEGQQLVEMMLQPGELPSAPLPEGTTLCTDPQLWPLRERGLLPDTVDPDGWYADACARRARGLAEIWTVEREGCPIATAGLYSLRGAPFGGYLSGVFTHPSERGRGIALALISRLIQKRAVPIRLLCRPPLTQFYSRVGFVPTGQAFLLTIQSMSGGLQAGKDEM